MTEVSLKHRLEYCTLRVLALLVKTLPREQALKLGGRLGIFAGMVLPSRYRLAEENLRRAFPEWSQRKVRTTCWANFQHVGICGAELLRLDMLRGDADDLQRYYDVVGSEHLEQALALKKGVIMLTGHVGFWEAGNYVLSAQGYAAAAVTKPLKNSLSDKYITKLRETFGCQIIDSRKGARKILKALQEEKIVGILLDQHISPPGSVPTEFFGRMAYTTTAITNLAMKYQIPILPAFCQRLPDGRYRVKSEPMIMLEGEGDEAIARNTQLLTSIIETAVRRDPSQWFWMHKRWRVPKQNSDKS